MPRDDTSRYAMTCRDLLQLAALKCSARPDPDGAQHLGLVVCRFPSPERVRGFGCGNTPQRQVCHLENWASVFVNDRAVFDWVTDSLIRRVALVDDAFNMNCITVRVVFSSALCSGLSDA